MHRAFDIRFALAALTLILVAGCQSNGPSASAPTAPKSAVVITTGQGATTVYLPTADGGVERLASSNEAATCPQCEADVAAYFKGGTLAPKCTVCGAMRTPVMVPATPYVSHN